MSMRTGNCRDATIWTLFGVSVLFATAGCVVQTTKEFRNLDSKYTLVERGTVHRFSAVKVEREAVSLLPFDAAGREGVLLYEGPKPKDIWDARRMVARVPLWRSVRVHGGDLWWVSRDVWVQAVLRTEAASHVLWIIGNDPLIIGVGTAPAPKNSYEPGATSEMDWVFWSDSPTRLLRDGDLEGTVGEVLVLENGYELYKRVDRLYGNERIAAEAEFAARIRRMAVPARTTVRQVLNNPKIATGNGPVGH